MRVKKPKKPSKKLKLELLISIEEEDEQLVRVLGGVAKQLLPGNPLLEALFGSTKQLPEKN